MAGVLAETAEALQNLATAVETTGLGKFLDNPKLEPSKLQAALLNAANAKEQAVKLLTGVLSVLAETKHYRLLPDISLFFIGLAPLTAGIYYLLKKIIITHVSKITCSNPFIIVLYIIL